nr:MAG TPA: hypothetical protein [Bacteriophage sp.]
MKYPYVNSNSGHIAAYPSNTESFFIFTHLLSKSCVSTPSSSINLSTK